MKQNLIALLSGLALVTGIACAAPGSDTSKTTETSNRPKTNIPERQLATFGGGCFWCMEGTFEKLKGVDSVISGYTGGVEKNPTDKEVSRGTTGHTEAVQITFNPTIVTYEQLLDTYWKNIDPTDSDGQFADRGSQYRPGIFFHNEAQKHAAISSRSALEESGHFQQSVVVEITAYTSFYPAKNDHQDYYRKNPEHYKAYRKGSGRTGFLEKVWGGK